jgi:hypothetical protein
MLIGAIAAEQAGSVWSLDAAFARMSRLSSPALEELDRALVPPGLLERAERPEVPPAPGPRVFLS